MKVLLLALILMPLVGLSQAEQDRQKLLFGAEPTQSGQEIVALLKQEKSLSLTPDTYRDEIPGWVFTTTVHVFTFAEHPLLHIPLQSGRIYVDTLIHNRDSFPALHGDAPVWMELDYRKENQMEKAYSQMREFLQKSGATIIVSDTLHSNWKTDNGKDIASYRTLLQLRGSGSRSYLFLSAREFIDRHSRSVKTGFRVALYFHDAVPCWFKEEGCQHAFFR